MGNQPSSNNNTRHQNNINHANNLHNQQALNNQIEIQRLQMEAIRNNPSLANNPMINNPNLYQEINTNPHIKSQFLRLILNEFKNKMSRQQIHRINTMLMELPVQPSQRSIPNIPSVSNNMPLMSNPSRTYNRQQQEMINKNQNNRVGVRTRGYITDEEREQLSKLNPKNRKYKDIIKTTDKRINKYRKKIKESYKFSNKFKKEK